MNQVTHPSHGPDLISDSLVVNQKDRLLSILATARLDADFDKAIEIYHQVLTCLDVLKELWDSVSYRYKRQELITIISEEVRQFSLCVPINAHKKIRKLNLVHRMAWDLY